MPAMAVTVVPVARPVTVVMVRWLVLRTSTVAVVAMVVISARVVPAGRPVPAAVAPMVWRA